MEIAVKPPGPRFKSSQVLKNILKQNRDLTKCFYTRKSSITPKVFPEVNYKKKKSDQSSPPMPKWSGHTNTFSQASVKPTQIFLLSDINKLLETSMYRVTKKTKRTAQTKSNFYSIHHSIRTTTPEFFRQALHTVLKEPTRKSK